MAKETYTLVKAADKSREQFGDAKSAAEAFSKANAAEKPTVVKTTLGKGAEFVAGTSEIKAAIGKDFSKYVGHTDKAFRDAWSMAEMHREKGADALEAAGREKQAAQVDMNKLEKAEIGKTYRGPIMAVTAEIIVQRRRFSRYLSRQPSNYAALFSACCSRSGFSITVPIGSQLRV